MLVGGTLTVCAVTVSAAITSSWVVDKNFSNSADPDVDAAYHVTGSWTPLTPGDLDIRSDVFWDSAFSGSKLTVGGVDIWLLRVDANHKGVAPAPPGFTAVLGMADVVGNDGTVETYVPHSGAVGDGDYYKLTANIAPAGTMNFDLKAAHLVPEPGSFAMIAGLGLVGFATYRRIRA